jgi:hypothetical protein
VLVHVLVQRPAGGDVHHLHPAADAEDGHAAGGRAPRERQLERVRRGLGDGREDDRQPARAGDRLAVDDAERHLAARRLALGGLVVLAEAGGTPTR